MAANDLLYHDRLLSHYHAPNNYGLKHGPYLEVHGSNPLCGDSMTVQALLDGERIGDVRFEHNGCVVSRAAASVLSEYIRGKTIGEMRVLSLTDVLALLDIAITPARFKCATLFLDTLRRMF